MISFELIAIGEIVPDRFSRGLQGAMKTNYSHLAILVNGVELYHATEKGFHRELSSSGLEGAVIRHRFPLTIKYHEQFALGWLAGRVGCRYSWIQYFGLIFPWMRWIPFVKNGRAETVCSEVVADFLVDCTSISHPKLDQCDWLTPRDVVELMLEVANG